MTTIIIENIKTGKTIEREMNAEELTQWETDQSTAAAAAAEEAAKIAAREAVLAKLGLTAEEAAALLS